MEVNSSPGLEGIQKTTGVDVAEAIIEHVERSVTTFQPDPETRETKRKKRRAS
jgi:ribosomal protein S6--L-glutamate ligase